MVAASIEVGFLRSFKTRSRASGEPTSSSNPGAERSSERLSHRTRSHDALGRSEASDCAKGRGLRCAELFIVLIRQNVSAVLRKGSRPAEFASLRLYDRRLPGTGY